MLHTQENDTICDRQRNRVSCFQTVAAFAPASVARITRSSNLVGNGEGRLVHDKHMLPSLTVLQVECQSGCLVLESQGLYDSSLWCAVSEGRRALGTVSQEACSLHIEKQRYVQFDVILSSSHQVRRTRTLAWFHYIEATTLAW
jgi:hypothetical protein